MSSSRKTQYAGPLRLRASHSRAMFVLIGPSAQTTTHAGAPPEAPPELVEGPVEGSPMRFRLSSSPGRYVVLCAKTPSATRSRPSSLTSSNPQGTIQPSSRPDYSPASATNAPDQTTAAPGRPAPRLRSPDSMPVRRAGQRRSPLPGAAHVMISQPPGFTSSTMRNTLACQCGSCSRTRSKNLNGINFFAWLAVLVRQTDHVDARPPPPIETHVLRAANKSRADPFTLYEPHSRTLSTRTLRGIAYVVLPTSSLLRGAL